VLAQILQRLETACTRSARADSRAARKAALSQPDQRLHLSVRGSRAADLLEKVGADTAAHVDQLLKHGHAADSRGEREHPHLLRKH
jgi:hypothetical protein